MRRFLPLLIMVGAFAYAQDTPPNPPNKEAAPVESKGMPPRAAPGDYASQGKAGDITIAAEFAGHSVPKPEGPLSTEDFVVVEVGVYGKDGQHLTFSLEDFTLRINGKKTAQPRSPFGMVARSLRDPEYMAAQEVANKEKAKEAGGGNGINTGGAKDTSSSTPPIIHIPIEMQRSMMQYIQRNSLPEGDRALPVAGLMFFRYGGKAEGIHSLELTYSGPAGKATLMLQP